MVPVPRTYGPAHCYFTLQMINTDWSQFVFAHLDVSRRARSHAVRLILIFFRFISTPDNNASNASTQFLIPRIVLFNSPNSFDLKIWTKKRGICDILYAMYFAQIQFLDFRIWLENRKLEWNGVNWQKCFFRLKILCYSFKSFNNELFVIPTLTSGSKIHRNLLVLFLILERKASKKKRFFNGI